MAAFSAGNHLRAETDDDLTRTRDAEHERGRQRLRPAPAAVGVLEPAHPGMQDAPHARQFAFFVQADADERAVKIRRRGEPTRLQRVEGPRLGETQAVQPVGRSLVAREHVGLGQDQAERDGP